MTITKTTVTHLLIDPSGDAIQRGGSITLGGFVGGVWRDVQGMTADGQVITWEAADADASGAWSVDLIPNADVANPEHTLYRYQPAAGVPVVFEVGSVSPSTLADLVVTDPSQWPSLTPTTVGPVGPSGTIAVGTVTTGAAGSSAAVTNSGTSTAAVFDFTIPQGDTGDAATIAAGTVTMVAPTDAASVANSGTSAAAIFDFDIPRGATILAGSGAPSDASDGEDTDFYIDTTGHKIYGPKASGAWPAGVDLVGPQGVQGDPWSQWQGTWSSSTAYVVNDAVAYNGSSYICTAPRSATATTPDADSAHWDLIAAKGTDGTGSGDVSGPSSATDGNLALFDGTTGKLLKDGGALATVATSGSYNDLDDKPSIPSTAADVGAIPDPVSKNAGDIPQWDGSDWTAVPPPSTGGASLSTVFMMMGA